MAAKEEKLETLELMKQNLQAKLENLKETTIIKKTGYLKNPVKPKKMLNVIIAGAIGLMMFLPLAFFMEYLEGVRRREGNK
jgi:capsular polysaccharide biosynthesis protein